MNLVALVFYLALKSSNIRLPLHSCRNIGSHVIGDQSTPSRVALLYTPPLRFEAIEHLYQIASGFRRLVHNNYATVA